LHIRYKVVTTLKSVRPSFTKTEEGSDPDEGMSAQQSAPGVVSVLALVALAGCAGLFGGDTPAETLTPAPVPENQTSTPTPNPTTAATTTVDPENSEYVTQPRYLALRPNCERPPGLVIHIQVSALRNNDPATDEGINTTWQFASPSNRAVTGPYANFVRLIEENFQPLLNAETVRYGRLFRNNGTAFQNVVVTGPDGSIQSYRWSVQRQSGGQYDGCWMTASVRPTDSTTRAQVE